MRFLRERQLIQEQAYSHGNAEAAAPVALEKTDSTLEATCGAGAGAGVGAGVASTNANNADTATSQ